MKHAIPVKFIAILLCAVSLLAAVGGGLSIVLLAENGLYEKTPAELYAERMEDQAYFFAEELAQSYASVNLGGCPEEMIGHYHYLNYGYYGYILQDAEGNVLDELTLPDAAEKSYPYHFTINGSYMNVLNTYDSSADSDATQESGLEIYDAVAEEGCLVFGITYHYLGDGISTDRDEPIGYLEYNGDGCVQFTSFEPYLLGLPVATEPNHVEFSGENGELIYSITDDGSVGQLFYDEGGLLRFTAAAASAEDHDLSVPDMTEPAVSEADIQYFEYYDETRGSEVTVEYSWLVMPEYTVTMTLLPGATSDIYSYTLAGVLHGYRNYFPWLLAAGLLLFAVTLVYLCCAAGHKPGTDEVRPTALNRLPLDLYLGADILAVAGLGVACVEGGAALFRENTQVGLGFVAVTGCAIALIAVAYVFAFAAQVKCKNRWWLRNTFCGRLLVLIVRFARRVRKGVRRGWPDFCSGVKRGWNRLVRFLVRTCRFLKRSVISICLFLGRSAKTIWKYSVIYIVKAYHISTAALQKFFSWLGRHINRFFSLIPLTWQWLLIGFVLMFLIFAAVRSSSGGMMIFFLCASFAVILYGAHCFGVLLESAKRMSKGDLETAVDDKLLIGSFRDFSGALNALAGVTTVAVQKQLRSERMKAELVTNVSHDIKTPLTSIINYVDLMKMPHTDEEHELYLEVLDRQSQRLKKLIEDLMEMSKASTGNINVELSEVDAAEAVNQALGEFSDKFNSVNLMPVFHQPQEPVRILADGRLVWRILSNLLNNAYKYALPGTRLYIDLMVLEGCGVIAIKNISKEQLNVAADELMERFVRGDASRNTEGSGLGLNIAKSLAELQNAKMELTVDGDLFKVTLFFPLA